jgi:competence protein ComEC
VPLIYLACAWVTGIFLGSRFNLPATLIPAGLVPLLPLLFSRRWKFFILTSLCLLFLLTGAWYSYSRLHASSVDSIRSYNNRGAITIKGMVDEDPEVGDKATQLRLSVSEIRTDNDWSKVTGSTLLFVPRYSAYRYGDVLLVDGELETPADFDDFDYRGYLAQQGIYSIMYHPKIEILERGQGFKLLEWVYALRNRLSQSLTEVLPEPQASLAQGIILGNRGNIPEPLLNNFSRTGTAHILAISGLHIAIVVGMILSLGILIFGRRHYIYVWLTLGLTWLYTILTGMNPPVVRAAIMASMFLIAEPLGRQRSAITALALAAAVMVGVDPGVLWQASFQMSFMAMAGLIFVFPPLQTAGRKAVNATLGEEGVAVSIARSIIDSFGVSLAALIGVWPLVAYYFGIISPVGPLATFFALPALADIIITGALTGGLALIALPVAQVAGWATWLFLSYMILVVNGFAAIPASAIEVGKVNVALVFVYYLVVAAVIWLARNRASTLATRPLNLVKSGAGKIAGLASNLPVRWIIPPFLVAAILASVAAATMPDDNLHVSFLDVGQGDAILIQKGSLEVLVDGGPSPQAIALELGKKLPFWDRTIELVVLSHPDADHVNGLVEVLKRYRVEQVLYPELDSNSTIYGEWLRTTTEKNIKSTVALAGESLNLGGTKIEVLNPQPDPLVMTKSDTDNNGVVMRVSAGTVSFLLTADIMREAEFTLITGRSSLRSTVLKVGHHGSDTSTTPEFLAVVSPQVAVISVGADNPYGHPSNDVMSRLKEKVGLNNIYRTDEQGTVEFITDGERLWVKTR